MIYIFHPFNFDILDALSYELNQLGLKSRVIKKLNKEDIKKDNDNVYIAYFNSGMFNNFGIPNKIIFLNVTPLHERHVINKIRTIHNKNKFLDKVLAYWSYVKSHGSIIRGVTNKELRYDYVPFGYSDYYQQMYCPEYQGTKEVDFLFYGSSLQKYKYRRGKAIAQLRKAGLKIKYLGEDGKRVCGKPRNEWIAKSKMVLVICHSANGIAKENDLCRLAFLLSNKIFVIAERSGDPLVENQLAKYIPMCKNMQEMEEKCKYYLAMSETERQKIANEAGEKFKQDFALRKFIPVKFLRSLT